VIRLYHVDKAYDRDTLALSDISLQVERGEFCFLTGGSGAGKTTLLRMLFREERSTRGDILVGGKNINVLPQSQIPLFRRSIGVVFQDFKLLKERTVVENVAFVLRLLGWGRKARQERAVTVLKAVGLAHRLNHYPLQLSGGEQQRVAIARALANEPALLLADEPTGNLDSKLAEEILRLFLEINARGTTVLVATHDHHLLQTFARRTISLDHGRLMSHA
jgi:cell division transport system ATP-binding protein